jgi:hypothetical protein
MKIAILYSGRVLNWDDYYKNLQHYIVKGHDVDFFFFHNKNQDEDLTGFIELYKPKIVMDEEILAQYSVTPMNMSGMYMFYSRNAIFKAFKQYVLENNCQYDFVCSYRLDLLTLCDIHFETLIHNDQVVNIPNIAHSGGINDFMAIGSMNAMEKYCSLAENYETLLTATRNTGSNEFMLLTYLESIHLRVNFYPFRCLLRDDIRENGGAVKKLALCKENLFIE